MNILNKNNYPGHLVLLTSDDLCYMGRNIEKEIHFLEIYFLSSEGNICTTGRRFLQDPFPVLPPQTLGFHFFLSYFKNLE